MIYTSLFGLFPVHCIYIPELKKEKILSKKRGREGGNGNYFILLYSFREE